MYPKSIRRLATAFGAILLLPFSLPAQGFIQQDSRWNYPHFLGFRPADAQAVDVNPPRFSWPYRQGTVGSGNESIKTFTFQVDDDQNFGSPEVNVQLDYNFYNALQPFGAGTWYWRVGYDDDNSGSITSGEWSSSMSFEVTGAESTWDRSGRDSAVASLTSITGSARPRFGPVGGDWSAYKTFLENSSRGQDWLNQLVSQANAYVAMDFYADPANYFPPTDEDGNVLDIGDANDDAVEWDNGAGGTERWTANSFGRNAQRLVVVAFAHKVTGDSAYAGAKDLLLDLAAFPYTATNDSLSWPEWHGAPTKQTVCIAEYLALVYDWYYDDLNATERQTLIDAVSLRVQQVYFSERSWSNGSDVYSQGMAMKSSSHPYQNFYWAMPGALLLVGEDSSADTLMNSSELMPLLIDFSTGVTASALYGPDDGAINEGPGYGGEKQGTMLRTLLMTEVLLDLGQEQNPFLHGYQEWFSHVMPSGYQRIAFGDQWGFDLEGTQLRNQHALTLLLGDTVAGRKAKARWDNEVSDQGDDMEFSTFSRPWTVMLAEQRLSSGSGLASDAVTASAEDSNVLFAESGWVMVGKNPPTSDADFDDGVRMTFQSKTRGYMSHNYPSENAFNWYAYGEPLAVGGGSRRRPDPFANHTMSHNAVLIDGIGQSFPSQDNPAEPYIGRLLAYEEGSLPNGGSYVHWVGDASHAYQGLSGAGLKRWHRHVILVDDAYFVLYDDLEMNDGAQPVTFSWLMQVDKPLPQDVTLGGNEFSWAQSGVNARVVFARNASELDIVHQSGTGAIEDPDNSYASNNGWEPDAAGNNVFDNPVTGEDRLLSVLAQFDDKPPVSGSSFETVRYYFSESEYREQDRTQNILWVNNAAESTRWQMMSALLAWPDADTAPVVTRLSNSRMQFTFDGTTRIISFDPTQPGDYTVTLNDYRAHAGEVIPSIPSVSVSRAEATVDENDSNVFSFTINRADNYESSVTVDYTLSGSALQGTDYTDLAGGSVTIPAEVSSALVEFTVSDDVLLEGDETITLTIDTDAAYTIDQGSAEITILDDETINLSEIQAALGPNSSREYQLRITNPTSDTQSYTVATQPLTEDYQWNSSLNHNSQAYLPEYNWIDLANDPSASQAQSYTSAFDTFRAGAVSPIDLPIGFSFPFFDTAHSSLTIHFKGFLMFKNGYIPDPTGVYYAREMPTDNIASDMVVPFWSTWREVDGTQEIYWKQMDADTFVVQWENLGLTPGVYGTDATGSFQAILRSDGSMKFQYRDYQLNGLLPYAVALQDYVTSAADSEVFEVTYRPELTDGIGSFVPRGLDVDFAVEVWPNVEFINLSETSFNLLPGETKLVTVTLSSTGVFDGTHTNSISILDGNDDLVREIPVQLIVGDDFPPEAPAGLGASVVSAAQVDLYWQDNSDVETSFVVERSESSGSGFAPLATLSANVTSYTDTSVSDADTTSYFYRVFASNTNGDSDYSNVAQAGTDLPAAPSSLNITRVEDDAVLITWTDNADNESGYLLERSTSQDSGFIAIGLGLQTSVNASSYVDSGISDLANTVYYYRVRAINPIGSSAVTPTDSAGGDGSLMPTQGLVFYYPFDETGSPTTVADQSGNGNDANITGSSSFVDGRIGNAIRFPSSGFNHVDTTQNFQAVDGTGYSAAAWVYLETFPPADSAKLFQHHDAGSTVGRSWINLDHNGSINTYTGGALTESSPGLITTGQWYHVAMSAGEGVVTLYIDGVQVAQRNDTVESNIAPIRMGNHKPPQESSNRQLNGLIDEARVYNRRLTLSEVQLLAGQPANDFPSVSAGSDQSVLAGQSFNLSGTANDPDDQPSTLTVEWSQLSGPGLAVFGDTSSLTSSVSFPNSGDYTLRLTADDGSGVVSDDVVFSAQSSPVSLTAQETDFTDITLSWPDASGETGYRVELRKQGAATWMTLAYDLPAGTVSFVITGLIQDQDYDFKVSALDGSAARVGAEASLRTLPADMLVQGFGAGDLIVVEAENYSNKRASGNSDDEWLLTTIYNEYSGDGAMVLDEGSGQSGWNGATVPSTAPELNFDIYFQQTGTHYLWVRAQKYGSGSDSLHAGINSTHPVSGEVISRREVDSNFGANDQWYWLSATAANDRASVDVPSAGVHRVNIWGREDGVRVDKILLTTDSSYTPNDLEPESFVTTPVFTALEEWRITHFGTAMASGDSADGAELVNDGMRNFMKFALGGTPWSDANTLQPEHAVTPVALEEYLEFTYRRRQGSGTGTTESGYTVDGVTYTVQMRSSLSSGNWETGASIFQEEAVSSNGDGTDDVTVRCVDPVSDSDSAFIRLKVE